jgi:small subunit ribosomal protein S8
VPSGFTVPSSAAVGPKGTASKTEIPRVLGGLGVVIVSTSQGIMTGQKARRSQLGGEVLAYVW